MAQTRPFISLVCGRPVWPVGFAPWGGRALFNLLSPPSPEVVLVHTAPEDSSLSMSATREDREGGNTPFIRGHSPPSVWSCTCCLCSHPLGQDCGYTQLLGRHLCTQINITGLLPWEKGEWILGDNCQYLPWCYFTWGTVVYTHCHSLKTTFQ